MIGSFSRLTACTTGQFARIIELTSLNAGLEKHALDTDNMRAS